VPILLLWQFIEVRQLRGAAAERAAAAGKQ